MNVVICYRCHVRQMGTGQGEERSTLLEWDAGQDRLYGKEDSGHRLPLYLHLFYLMHLLLMASASVYTAFLCAKTITAGLPTSLLALSHLSLSIPGARSNKEIG